MTNGRRALCQHKTQTDLLQTAFPRIAEFLSILLITKKDRGKNYFAVATVGDSTLL